MLQSVQCYSPMLQVPSRRALLQSVLILFKRCQLAPSRTQVARASKMAYALPCCIDIRNVDHSRETIHMCDVVQLVKYDTGQPITYDPYAALVVQPRF